MFRRHQGTLISNPACTKETTVTAEDFLYYDKDGFELNQAEQKFYSAMNFPINNPILNHRCWQQPWFELERDDLGLILDHSMFLCRASYSGAAQEQLEQLKSTVPLADYLLKTRAKWGYDFALDAVHNAHTYEVIHIEFDSHDYEQFKNHLIHFEYIVRHTDWQDAAKRIWQHRDQWQHLKGFAQNHWKAEFLIGWKRAEYTEKAY
jgi:hypothetical protein